MLYTVRAKKSRSGSGSARQAMRRRGTFTAVTRLTSAINNYVTAWNTGAKPFAWTAGFTPRSANLADNDKTKESISDTRWGEFSGFRVNPGDEEKGRRLAAEASRLIRSVGVAP